MIKRLRQYKLSFTPRQFLLVASLILVSFLGISTKLYSGPGQDWIHHYSGGIFYEIFFCLLIALLLPSLGLWKIGTIVFSGTSLIEFLQLYHSPWLQYWRSIWIGKALLGTTFNVMDFPYYFLGCVVGILWIHAINRYTRDKSDKH